MLCSHLALPLISASQEMTRRRVQFGQNPEIVLNNVHKFTIDQPLMLGG